MIDLKINKYQNYIDNSPPNNKYSNYDGEKLSGPLDKYQALYEKHVGVNTCYSHLKSNSERKKIQPYQAFATSNTPGISNIAYSPYDVYTSGKSFFESNTTNDTETQIDSGIRLAGTPFSFANSFTSILDILATLKVLYISSRPLMATNYITGLILCGIELIVESIGLKRELSFEKEWIRPIEHLLKKEELTDEEQTEMNVHLSKLYEKYFELTEDELLEIENNLPEDCSFAEIKQHIGNALNTKYKDLARRVDASCAQRLFSHYQELKTGMVEGIKSSLEVVTDVDIQKTKKILLHTIGIIALGLTIVGLTFGLLGFPPALIFAFLIGGALFGIVRYAIAKGLLPTERWHFEVQRLNPFYSPKPVSTE